MSPDPQNFDYRKFFKEFCRYLSSERLQTVKYACLAASPEQWFQVEALSWLNTHRAMVGLAGGTTECPAWHLLYEKRKTDLWLENSTACSSPSGIAIELKVIFNNKNFDSKIREIRRDLSIEKALPHGFSPESTLRLGLIIGIYVRYSKPGGFQYLHDLRTIASPERFSQMLHDGLVSEDSWYRNGPKLMPVEEWAQIASLDGECYIDPSTSGNGVWLGLLMPKAEAI